MVIEAVAELLARVQCAEESMSVEFAGAEDEEHIPMPDGCRLRLTV